MAVHLSGHRTLVSAGRVAVDRADTQFDYSQLDVFIIAVFGACR